MGGLSSSQEDALMDALGLSGAQQRLVRETARVHGREVLEQLHQSIVVGVSADELRRIHTPSMHSYKSSWDRITSQMAGVYHPEGQLCQEDGQKFPCRTRRAIDSEYSQT